MKQKDFIENEIRQGRYFIGLDLGPFKKGLDEQREMTAGLLKLVSEDLYSLENHFVLELIQNADDNSYEQPEPAISFSVVKDNITVHNNEIGFSEANVSSLCFATKSTKKLNKEGLIGEKGIGFKSVFAVTSKPEIHSNGFHFYFDMSGDDPLGSVVPSWIDSPQSSIRKEGTTIILPAKTGKEFTDRTLEPLKPELLLFLRKLRKIRIETGWNNSVRDITRQDVDNNILLLLEKVKDSSGTELVATNKYLSIPYRFDVSDIIEAKRPGFETTELVLTFPLTTEEEKPKLNAGNSAYAFLPIRDYGLNFIVQADFLLSSSREDIHFENEWNQKIRDQIPEAFIKALDVFKEHPNLKTSFYSFLIVKRTNEYFSTAISKTIDLLSESECVLTQSGSWLKPSDVLIGSKADQQLISNEELKEILGKEYASSEIPGRNEILSKIGLREFNLNHLLACLDNQVWLDSKPVSWITELLVYLSRETLSDAVLERLRKRKIIPLTNGERSSIHEGEIFLSLGKREKYGFEHELRTIDPQVLKVSANQTEIWSLLSLLNVRAASFTEIIDNHILPIHNRDSITSTVAALIGHVRYIKDNLDEYLNIKKPIPLGQEARAKSLQADILEQFSKLWLHISSNDEKEIFDRLEDCYVGSNYKNDLESIFIDPTVLSFISNRYIRDSGESELKTWFDFFIRLGANKVPRVTKDKKVLPTFPGIKNGFYKSFMVQDWVPSDEMVQLIQSEDKKRKSRFLKLLDQNWSSYYFQCMKATVTPLTKNAISETPPSTLLRQLQMMKVYTKDNKWTVLPKCYVETEEIVTTFGKRLPFLDTSSLCENLLDQLGITYKVSLQAAVNRLKELSAGNGPFTKESLVTLYKVIEIQTQNDPLKITQVCNEFAKHALINIPKHPDKWLKTEEVCWEGINNLVGKIVPSLRERYGDVESFFKKILKVKISPDPEQLIRVLQSLPKLDADIEEKDNAAELIYRALGKELRSNKNDSDPDWLGEFKDGLFWTNKHELWANEDDLFINDDPEIGALFNNNPKVAYLQVRRDDISNLDVFINKTGLKYLSNSISVELAPDIKRNYLPDLSRLLEGRFILIARHLYTHHNYSYDPVFSRLLDTGKIQKLAKSKIFSADNLRININLNEESATIKRECCIVDDGIYIDNELLKDEEIVFVELASELAKALDVTASKSFINQILESRGEAKLERITRDLRNLPKEEEHRFKVKTPEPELAITESPDEEPEADLSESEEVEIEISSSTVSDLRAGQSTAQIDDISVANKGQSPHKSSSDAVIPKVRPDHIEQLTDISPNHSQPKDGSSQGFNSGSVIQTPQKVGQDEPGFRNNAKTLTVPNKKGRGHGLSYTVPDKESTETSDKEKSDRDMAISEAAVSVVIKAEEAEGFQAVSMEHFNKGYDIHSKRGNEERFIEVKGKEGPWDEYGVSVSPAQVQFAKEHRQKVWLYVVEYATSPNAVLHRIQDPYEKITKFMFDNGWKSFATTPSEIKEPKEGMRITLKEGKGTIVGLNRFGKSKLFRLTVKLDGQSEYLVKPYIPHEMHLE